MPSYTVRFDRQTEANGDLEIARKNFPSETNDEILLYDQFVVELRQNDLLRGKWRIINSLKASDALFTAWVSFEWPGTVESFTDALQVTFDEHGMSGDFTIVETVG